jgi:selenium metabolism protein YedF
MKTIDSSKEKSSISKDTPITPDCLKQDELFYSNLIQESALYQELYCTRFLESMVIVLANPFLGQTDNPLNRTLLKSFIYVIAERETKPTNIVLLTKGVELACEGSEVLDALNRLEEEGVSIMVCGASLNYHKIRQFLKIGYISNMYDIVEVMMQNPKVITL